MPEFERQEFGEYVLHDRIGAGGMAEIFLATSRGVAGFEKRLVIKRILPTLSDDEQFVRMFIEEAKLCVALRHPNIVQVYDLGEIEAQYFIAMEFVDGRDLLKTLAACGRKKIGFPTDIALYIVMEVLKGLDYAHKLTRPNGDPLGIIHRDVSPSNVLLSFEGEVKIGDFGIAKATTREKTAAGILKGKFGYMAPEQVVGAPIDHRADIFAAGILLYELLTGHRLFAGKSDLAVLARVRDARIEPPPRHYRPDLDPELEHIVLKALSRGAGVRFQSASALHDAIHDYVFRSRALIGPMHLGQFMQRLFLSEPEEIARRNRIPLPPIAEPLNEPGNGHLKSVETTSDIAIQEENAPRSELASQLAFVAPNEDWEKRGPAPADPDEENPPVKEPAVVPGAIPDEDLERTVRTQVTIREEDELDSAVEAIDMATGCPVELDAKHDFEPEEDARQAIRAIRRAQEENQETDLDLDEEARALKENRMQIEVRSGDRSVSSIDTMVSGETPVDGHEPSPSERSWSPVDIVERTLSSIENDDEETNDDQSSPTVRFDSDKLDSGDTSSDVMPAIDRNWPSRSRKKIPEEYKENVDEPSDYGTIQVEESDLPTAEMHESDIDLSTSEEDSTTAANPTPSEADLVLSSMDGSLEAIVSPVDTRELKAADTESDNVPQVLGDQTIEEDDLTENMVDSAPEIRAYEPTKDETLSDEDLLDGQTEEIDSAEAQELDALDQAPSTARSVSPTPAPAPTESSLPIDAAERRMSRIRRMNGPSSNGEESRTRRRPITGRRPRPILVPSEDGESTLQRRSSSSNRARRSPIRRRIAVRSALSVVNPRRGIIGRKRDPLDAETVPLPDEEKEEEITASGPADVDETEPTGGEQDPEVTARYDSGGQFAEPFEDEDELTDGDDRPSTKRVRSGSGVTAVLSEAAEVDEAIAQLRVDQEEPPNEKTTAGELIGGIESPASIPKIEEDEDEDEDDEVDIRKAIMRRQSRRRLVTQNVVLYSDESTPHPKKIGPADDSEEQPVITAGKLEDPGAEELFGVLSVLDHGTLELGFDQEEEISLETVSGEHSAEVRELQDSFRDQVIEPSEPEEEEEHDETRLGTLAPEETGAGPIAHFTDPDEETTASAEDDDVAPKPTVEIPDTAIHRDSSGIEIEFPEPSSEPSGLMENVLSQSTVQDDGEGELFNETARRVDGDEPTHEEGSPLATTSDEGFPIAPSLSSSVEVPEDSTSNERPAHHGSMRLFSESFDQTPGESNDALLLPRDDTPLLPEDDPVRPVSLVHGDNPFEPTPMKVETPPISQRPEEQDGGKLKNRNNKALRAVVERHRRVKERNRGPGATPKATPTPPARAMPSPQRATPTAPVEGRGRNKKRAAPSQGMVPSASEAYPPLNGIQIAQRTPLNKLMTFTVLIAVILTVAAFVSMLLAKRDTPVPIPPQRQAPKQPANTDTKKKKADTALALVAADAGVEDAAPVDAGTPDAGAAEDATVPPPRRRPKRWKKRKRKKRRSRRGLGTIAISCRQPFDITVKPGGSWSDQTKFQRRFKPGRKTIVIRRNGKVVGRGNLKLMAGDWVNGNEYCDD